jgi:hypothetical protein
MSNEAQHKIDVLLKLAQAAWKSMDARRAYEWKMAVALWTALAALSGTSLRGEIHVDSWALYSASGLLILIWFIFVFVWMRGLHQRNAWDRDLAEYYWIIVEADLALGASTPRAARRGTVRNTSMWRDWSHSTQIFVTTFLVLLAIISISRKL